MKRIRVSGLAERDLDNIWNYIARSSGSIEVADRVLDSVTTTFRLLARAPEAGSHRDEIEPGARGFPAGKYIIYYHQSGRRLVISRVIHGMRDQKRAFLDAD